MVVLIFILICCVLISSILTLTTRSIYSAIFLLIVTYFIAAWSFAFLGAEFLTYVTIIVYLGAVVVLFIFASLVTPRYVKWEEFNFFDFLGAMGILFPVLFLINTTVTFCPLRLEYQDKSEIEELGLILYEIAVPVFLACGLLLLTAILSLLRLYQDRK